MTEEQCKPFDGRKVKITLIDGWKTRGMIIGVGYRGITIMYKGQRLFYRFSQLAGIREA